MSKLVTILGPTASGKTNLACELALKLNGEIISADSRQVYREMDLGTGKDIHEFTLKGKEIPYHLIDIVEPGYRYNIEAFQRDFIASFNSIQNRGNLPILCGGSGLYLETAIDGQTYLGIPKNVELRETLTKMTEKELTEVTKSIDPELLLSLTVQTKDRKLRAIEIDAFLKENPDFKGLETPTFENYIFGIDIDRNLRRERITKRLKQRFKEGMIAEVEHLLKIGLTHEDLEYYGLEYKWIGKFLKNEIDHATMFEQLNIAIHQFSKRQMTWFRGMERRGFKINWISFDLPIEEKLERICSQLQ